MPEETTDLFSILPDNNRKTQHIYSVSELTQDIKLILESSFEHVWVEGEISNFRPHTSGYFFSLKDEKALLNAVMFNRGNRELKFKLEDGLKVICFGKIEVYAPYGKYQIIVEKIEPKGIGGLQLALEQLKKRLEKEGLFREEHKRQIPYLPSKVGVVTSSHGAAIKDIFKVLERRFKDLHIIISPVRVQGEGAGEEIAEAIKNFNDFNQRVKSEERIDVMIIGRGGGSIEDLWAFNEEIVARAIYTSKIPVISAVGHERDWTIADLVADLRAPTPSIAAEIIIPKKEDLQKKLDDLTQDLRRTFLDNALTFEESIDNLTHRLTLSMLHLWELDKSAFYALAKKLELLNPAALIPQYKDKITDLARQIYVDFEHFIKIKDSQFRNLTEKMSSLNPLNILNRGYSVTFILPSEEVIKNTDNVNVGDRIKTKLYKGELVSEVLNKSE